MFTDDDNAFTTTIVPSLPLPEPPTIEPGPTLPPPPTAPQVPAPRGWLKKTWAIVGIASGFFPYIVPGFFALRSYTNWITGKKNKALFAWVWAGIGLVIWAFLAISLVALLAGGGWDGLSSVPSIAPHAPKLPALRLVFRDDFANPSSGWQVGVQDADATPGYVQGTYRIAYSDAASNGTLALRVATFSAGLVSVQADVRQVGITTPPKSAYGIGCAVDPSHLYSFVIDPGDGEWRIVDGSGNTLAEGWDVGAVHGGPTVNRIRGVCDSRTSRSTLIMFVNGREMGEAHQDVAPKAYTTMFMAIAPSGATVVQFDNAVFSAYAPGASAAALVNQGLLDMMSVQPADLSPDHVMTGLIDQGDQVAGQVTLDLCGASFPSESVRVARRQIRVDDASGRSVFETEAVLYQSPAATARAFAELQRAASTCRSRFMPSPVGGAPPLLTVIGPRPDRAWRSVAGVRRLSFDVTERDKTGHSFHQVLVYLRKGDVLLGLYFDQPNRQPPVAGQSTLEGITMVFQSRLAQLPPG